MKSVAVGAHLRREDIEPVAGPVPIGELWLSGVEVADDQPLSDRNLLLRVAAIREELVARATFIAIRYGYAFTTAAEAAEKTAAHVARWKKLLTEHRDNVEMTLKIAAVVSQPRPDRHDFAKGGEYLKALHQATHAAKIDDGFRTRIERIILPLTAQHRWIHRDNAALELAMLVKRNNVDAVRRAGQELKEASGTPFLLSGPWPLEVFAE
jgi:gas vesicle protein GvpL/GvpF